MKSDRILTIYSAVVSTVILLIMGASIVLSYWPYQNRSAAIEYLTTDKISLMDWGIKNLDEAISRTETPLLKKHKEIAAFLGNKILITSSTAWESAPDEDTAEKWCIELISEMKDRFNIDPKTGRPKNGNSSSVYIYFQHEGYRSHSEPENFSQSLDKIIELGAVVHVLDNEAQIECHSPLLSSEVILGEINYGT